MISSSTEQSHTNSSFRKLVPTNPSSRFISDFPHQESDWPDSLKIIDKNFAGVPEASAFLFAEKEGYAFHGQSVAAETGPVEIVLEWTPDPQRRRLASLPPSALGLTREERLDLAFALQQVRSYSEFAPQFIAIVGGDSSGVTELSRLMSVESSLSARADYRFSKNLSCALEYAFRDYDDKDSSFYNGSVNNIMLSLAANGKKSLSPSFSMAYRSPAPLLFAASHFPRAVEIVDLAGAEP